MLNNWKWGLFFSLSFIFFINDLRAQKIDISLYENKAQAYAILSAQYSEDAYFYARKNYFHTSVSAIKSNSDTGLVCMKIAMEFADSAFNAASDTSTEARMVMLYAKDYQQKTLKLFDKIRFEKNNSVIIYLCEEAMYKGANAIADAYKASLMFTMKPAEIPQKQGRAMFSNEEIKVPLIDTEESSRDITRLETDEFSFITIKELYGKRLIEIEDELLLLEAEAKKSKGDKLSEINIAIAHLKKDEKDLFDKMKNSEDKLVKVKNDLSKEMLQIVNKDIFTTDKPGFYSDKVPVPINIELPMGLVYRVQIGFFKSQLPPEHFEGIFPITSQKVDETYYRYVAGSFAKYNDAKLAKIAIAEKGYVDSFVVAYLNQNKISISDAIKEEKRLK